MHYPFYREKYSKLVHITESDDVTNERLDQILVEFKCELRFQYLTKTREWILKFLKALKRKNDMITFLNHIFSFRPL